MASADFVFFSWNRTQQNHETLRRTCLTRSGLTVVCGCRMLTGSVFWVLWGISLTFSAMKSWTPFSASTVPWIRHTRSVVPANTDTQTQTDGSEHEFKQGAHVFCHLLIRKYRWFLCNSGKSMNDIAAHYRLINKCVVCQLSHNSFSVFTVIFLWFAPTAGCKLTEGSWRSDTCRSRCPSFDSNSRSSRQNCSNFIIIQCAVE